MLLPIAGVTTQELRDEMLDQKGIRIAVLRLDQLHPVISGNKLFKLHYFLENALQQGASGILTFGGAWSNHLVATAYACREAGLNCTGIVRGEQPPALSHTLKACQAYGMELRFVSRGAYAAKTSAESFAEQGSPYRNYLVVPEGGYAPVGAAGAQQIMNLVNKEVTDICCAVGTGTTIAGLINGLAPEQRLVAIPVLRQLDDLPQRLEYLTKRSIDPQQVGIINDYHFGGYAKKNPGLLEFMNALYLKHRLPTDFVYTAKMMYGCLNLAAKDYFPPGSNVLCIHTGGLQGNASLPTNTLVF